MLLTKEVEIKLWGKTVKYYNCLGYSGKHGDIIIVSVNDLPKGSHARVEVLCDYCQKEVFSILYYHYNEETKYVNKHACKNCWQKKMEDVNMLKYGVHNVSEVKEIQERREETFKKRYGVSNPLQSKEIKDKHSQTIFSTYRVKNISQLEEVKKRKSQTTLRHYGVDCPSKNNKIKDKICMTNIEKYGVPYTMQSSEVRAKANETLCRNGTQKTSRQQLYLHSLYGGEINYAISYYAADICFPKEKIVIEYDGGGHDLRVVLGRLTREEFNRKEMIRNVVLKKEGYKRINIVSSKDLLPSDQILLQMLSDAKQYFADYPYHTWCSYDIDKNMLFDAEHKSGVSYDFGELRKINKITESENVA